MPRSPEQEGWEGPREGGRHRRLLLLLGGFALALLLVSLSGDGSLIRIYRLSRQRAGLLQDIERLRAENARLRLEVGALQQDETRLEEIARRKLGLVRPGEVIYRFAPPPGSSAEEGDVPATW